MKPYTKIEQVVVINDLMEERRSREVLEKGKELIRQIEAKIQTDAWRREVPPASKENRVAKKKGRE
jgi:hypothetical protein